MMRHFIIMPEGIPGAMANSRSYRRWRNRSKVGTRAMPLLAVSVDFRHFLHYFSSYRSDISFGTSIIVTI